jgi:uncharacterized delta-60 repeat protein
MVGFQTALYAKRWFFFVFLQKNCAVMPDFPPCMANRSVSSANHADRSAIGGERMKGIARETSRSRRRIKAIALYAAFTLAAVAVSASAVSLDVITSYLGLTAPDNTFDMPKGCAWQEQAHKFASDGGPSDWFGYSVAISGDTAVVGAAGDDAQKGSVYVFVRNGTAWTQQQKLTASDGSADEAFGKSVAITGDTVIVGAFADDGKGAAYVFTRSGTVWSEQQKLTASNGATGDRFGWSVAVNGDTAVVGSTIHSSARGSAYVFTRNGTVWSQQQELTASDGAANDIFGVSVELAGNTTVVGASQDDLSRGSAYVFVRSGTVWSEQQKLTASDGAGNDLFGASVSMSAETAVVGAYGDDSAKGSAYVFTRSGTVWSQQQKLTASDGAANDSFGWSVSVSGDAAIVGAYLDDSNKGSAYVFTRSGVVWTQQPKLTGSDSLADDLFGFAVAISGSSSIVGSYGDDTTGGMEAGSAYIFTSDCGSQTPTPTPMPSPSCPPAGTLDTTFDGDGIARTSGFDSYSVKIQSDGKIVAGGESTTAGLDFAVARYNTDGSLDSSFGTGGLVTTPIGTNEDRARSLQVQPDGKIVLAGYSLSANRDFAVVRYNTNGTLDTTFDGDGKAVIPIGASDDFAYSVARQSDGKLVIAGGAYVGPGINYDFGIVRLNTDGSLDTTFDGDGKAITPIGTGEEQGFSVVVQPDARIIVAGFTGVGSERRFALVRYNPNGSLDTTFDSDGIVTTQIGSFDTATAVALQTDGKIVAAGSTQSGSPLDSAVVRYSSDGSLDTTFSGDGKAVTAVTANQDAFNAVTIQPDGRIVAAGGAQINVGNNDPTIIRYMPDGSLDTTFDSDGIVVTPQGENVEDATSVALQPDGKIIAGGYSRNDTIVMRYLASSGCATPTPTPSTTPTPSPSATPTCVPALSGKALWHKAEGNALDSSGNNNNGTLVNGATFAPGKVGQAYTFSGTDYVQVPDSPSLDVTTEFTMDAWINPSVLHNGVPMGGIISKIGGGGGNNGYQFGLTTNNTQLWCQFNAPGEPWPQNQLIATVPGGVPLNQWTHVACTYDHADIKIFANGALIGTQNIGPKTVVNTSSSLRISSDDNNNVFFTGRIDEPEVYNRALSQAEIQSIVDAGSGGQCGATCAITSPENKVSWWKGEGDPNDSVGTNNGSLVGGTTYVTGRVGQAFNLNGTNAGVTIPHNTNLDIGPTGFSSEFWMKSNAAPTGQVLVVDKSHGFVDSAGWAFQSNPAANRIAWFIGAGGGGSTNFIGVESTVNPFDGAFHHVAGTWDGSDIRLYIDGALQGTTAFTSPVNNTRAVNIGYAWGGGNPGRWFNGIVDEVAVYARVLSQAEISASAGVCGPTGTPTPTPTPSPTPTPCTNCFVSTQSGSWGNPATWGGVGVPTGCFSDNVTISTGHTVTLDQNRCSNNLTLNGSAVLDISGFEFGFSGNNVTFMNNGTFTNSGAFNRLLAANGGAHQTWAGNGTYSGNLKLENLNTNWHIAPGATFTFDSAANNVNIQIDGSAHMDVSNPFDLIAPTGANYVIVENSGSFDGTSLVRTHGNMRVRMLHNSDVPVEVVSGTTKADGEFRKGFTVDTGASLALSGTQRVSNLGGGTGMIISSGASVDLAGNTLEIAWNGPFTNNGTVNNTGAFSHVIFLDNGVHAVSGVGAYSGNVGLEFLNNNTNIQPGTSITFGAPAGNTNIQVDSGAQLNFTGPGNLTLSGSVVNQSNGNTVAFNNGGASCGAANRITIRSSVAGTQRSWTGNTMLMVNTDVQDQAGTATVNVTGGMNSGNNGANWIFSAPCAATPTPTPLSTPTPTPTPTPTSTPTPTPTPTPTLTPSPTPTATPTPTLTPTPIPTITPTPTPSPTPTPATRTAFDYDGDGKADVSVFRPSDATWYIDRSRDGFSAIRWGLANDVLVPADYDTDGRTDIAVYRPSTGYWYILRSSDNTISYRRFGIAEDLPTPADYDGDAAIDISVFRPSEGIWYRIDSSNGTFRAYKFGLSGDKPTIGDFDGDHHADIAVYRPSNGFWYRINSSNGTFFGVSFGLSTDVPVPADYDGNGTTDIAVWRPSDGTWYRLTAPSSLSFTGIPFGLAADIPAAADYDGDGTADICVFRPSNGFWYILKSTNGAVVYNKFGLTGDLPTPSAFRY